MKQIIIPTVFRPFEKETLKNIQEHVFHVRKCFDWPGLEYHDVNSPEEDKFNRWCWHNLPALVELHHSPEFISRASDLAKVQLKPSYVFLSMYGPEGVCPLHTDRPQCQFTVDLVISQDDTWPIYVDGSQYVLQEGDALFYSGTDQPHYRKKMSEDSSAKYCNLAFFHFVPTSWMGRIS